MSILAINTAFSQSYVALKTENKTIYKSMDSSLKQSENILGLINDTINEANYTLNNVKTIACVIGPGSFTGIRIGASLAKGFCTAKTFKKISINSLHLIAYTFAKQNSSQTFWVVLNALSGNLFACEYNESGKNVMEPIMLSGDNLNQISGTIVGLQEEGLDMCNVFVNLSSQMLLEYAEHLEQTKCYSDDFVPLYLRKSQAEAELDSKKKNG